MELGLRGKVALVAASSQGIGRAIALHLAAEGASVALCARGGEALEATARAVEGKGGRALSVRADLTKAEDVKRFVSEAIKHFGRIDIVVVNAGGPPSGAFGTLGEEEWRRAVDLTLMSAVRLVKESLPHMTGGRIIAVSSTSIREPIDNLLLSNSLRLAVAGLLKTLSREVAGKGITVNAVLPGYVNTERLGDLFNKRAKDTGKSLEEVKFQVLREVPLGRFGEPEEVADLVTFLASERAGYITGTFIPVDGGRVKGY